MPRRRADPGRPTATKPEAGTDTTDTNTDTGTGTEAVTEAVLTASRVLVAVAARSLVNVDTQVTVPQFRALVVLSSRGSERMGGLADALAIHPSTATRLCDRLVAKRLVKRSTDPDNRRETLVSLTPSGAQLVDEVTGIRRREIARIVARIPSETRAPMVQALTAFADAAGEPSPGTALMGWA